MLLFRLVIVTFICIFLLFSQAHSQSDVPFIYFYSQQDTAFVIQRADGTEPRILAYYSPLPRHVNITGPGWSGSGNWFAWSTRGRGGGAFPENVHLIDRAGERQMVVLPDLATILGIRWSPVDDVIAVRYYDLDTSGVDNLVVFDPNSRRIVYQLLGADFNPESLDTILDFDWSADGSTLWLLDIASRRRVYVNTNTWESVTLPAPEVTLGYVLPTPTLLPDTTEFQLFGSEMQIDDPLYGSYVAVRYVRVHPDGQWAFILSEDINNRQLINVLHLDTGRQFELKTLCPHDSASCYGWMPPIGVE
jgi:hypothetical protein